MHAAAIDGSFAHLKLGRDPVRHDPRTVRLTDYVDLAELLPQVPPARDYTVQVLTGWPMYGNDQLGDCTWAAIGHMIQSWSANAGHPKTPTERVIETGYWETGVPPASHGVPDGPTDTGRVELDVLNYWRHHGVSRDHLVAYAAVDAHNIPMVKAAIYLFGGVYTGIALPVTAQRQTKEWDYVGGAGSDPGSWGGHAVPFLGYDADGVRLVTWGGVIGATWAFHTHYTEEVYALVDKQWFDQLGHSPAGFDLKALLADLPQVGHVQ